MTATDADVPRVVFDCDPGLDDAIALLMVAQLHRDGALILDGVTTVGGNCPIDITTANARFILRSVGLHTVPVVAGADRNPPDGVNGLAFHGVDCLGGLNRHPTRQPAPKDGAAEFIIHWASSVEASPRWLLATGPLSNIASALQREPNLPVALDRVVVMGGALGNPSGNIRPWAEFNFFADVASAALVCGSSLPLELITLDVTQRLLIGAGDIAQLASTLPGSLLAASIENTRRELGIAGCYMHDPMAAIVLADRSLFGWIATGLSVERDGAEPGRLRETRANSGKSRATSVDGPAAWSVILDLLVRGATHGHDSSAMS